MLTLSVSLLLWTHKELTSNTTKTQKEKKMKKINKDVVSTLVSTVTVVAIVSALSLNTLTKVNAKTSQPKQDNLIGAFIVEGDTMATANVLITNQTVVNYVADNGGFFGLRIDKPYKDKDAIFTFNVVDKTCEFNDYEDFYTEVKVNGVTLNVKSVCDYSTGVEGARTLVLDYDGAIYMYMALPLSEIGGEEMTVELDTGLTYSFEAKGYTKALTKIGG